MSTAEKLVEDAPPRLHWRDQRRLGIKPTRSRTNLYLDKDLFEAFKETMEKHGVSVSRAFEGMMRKALEE